MPFIALCPHCRSAKVSAPTRKRGTLHTCPKCQAEFPLEPLDESNLPVGYKLSPPEFDIDQVYREAEREDFASARTVVASALTGSAVVPLTAEKPKQVETAPTEPAIDYSPHASMSSDLPFTLVLIALGVFGVGMIATQFPYGRFIALPFLFGGLALGFMALPGLSGREKYGWAAVAANGLGLLFVTLLPSWLGLNAWVPQGNPDAGPKPVMAVRKSDNGHEPAPEWLDAYMTVWKQGDVKIEIISAVVESASPKAKLPIPLNTPPAPGQKRVLRLKMKVTNVGVARALPFTGWPKTAEPAPKLTDNTGIALPFFMMESEPMAPMYPGKEMELSLVFEPPVSEFEELRLELPPSAFEGTDAVKFLLRASKIGGLVFPKKN